MEALLKAMDRRGAAVCPAQPGEQQPARPPEQGAGAAPTAAAAAADAVGEGVLLDMIIRGLHRPLPRGMPVLPPPSEAAALLLRE